MAFGGKAKIQILLRGLTSILIHLLESVEQRNEELLYGRLMVAFQYLELLQKTDTNAYQMAWAATVPAKFQAPISSDFTAMEDSIKAMHEQVGAAGLMEQENYMTTLRYLETLGKTEDEKVRIAKKLS